MEGVKLEKFEGPLDLLLQFIEQERLSISEVALAKVTEQFFDYLNKLEEKMPEELADFLVIATKLVYIKSKNLLPYLYPVDEDGPSLAEQLKLYKRYADASIEVGRMWQQGLLAYGRTEPPVPVVGFVLPTNAKLSDLQTAFSKLLKRLKPISALPQVKIDHSISVKQRIESIFNAIKKWKKIGFKDLFGTAKSKTDVIVSFLALLELIKQEKISIHQPESFEEMEIERV